MHLVRKLTLATVLCASCQFHSFAEPTSQWTFVARVNQVDLAGELSLPFSVAIGDLITGTFTLDYADPGGPNIGDFSRLYSDQPQNLITASIGGIPLVDAPSSFAHSAEVWNNSPLHDNRDLFFMTYQTLLDPRFPDLEVNMSLSGRDQDGMTVSSLDLPTAFKLGDFGGLTFGLGIIDPVDVDPSYQLGARLIDLQPVIAEADSDGDGVQDEDDQCADTALGAVVDAHGCSLEQLVPCAGPGDGSAWKNHGHYVSSVVHMADAFLAAGLITEEQRNAAVEAAAQSDCGKE